MLRFFLALSLTVALLLAGSAAAQNDGRPKLRDNPEAGFKFADRNKDGKLSREEFKALLTLAPRAKDKAPLFDRLFDRLDANGDDSLSLDEFKKLGEMTREKGKLKGKEPDKDDKPAAEKPASPEGIAFFEKKIRPVLLAECYQCHSTEKGNKVRGGLALDTRDALRKGGDSGPALVPGQPARSLLLKALAHADPKLAMPPKKKLSDAIVRDFEEWIRLGAPDPRDGSKLVSAPIDLEKGRAHWAYQPVRNPPPPAVKDTAWPRSDIDRHILAALEAKKLAPSADADKRTLLRRVTLDLTGLPPTPEEVTAFLADSSPEAFARVVDRLLASRAFGERWGRHWLDVARYAESSGKAANFNYPHAWRYRDYVLAAFHADKPYDQFIREQLAGDLLPTSDPKLRAERTIATGFLALGPKTLNERNALQFELDVADEQIDVTSQAFLGITAACARCHDHKFDPISQRDYYALAGIFRSTETCYGTIRFIQSQRPSPLLDLPPGSAPAANPDKLTDEARADIEKSIQAIQARMKETKEPINNIFNAAQLALQRSRLDSYHSDGTPKLLAMGVRDKSGRGGLLARGPGMMGGGLRGFGQTRTVADSPIYARGEPEKPSADRVPRGTLQVLSREPLRIPAAASGRLQLADWIASKDNPLTARVMVNRVWLHLFGRGLVPTADDFGLSGRPPSHPALLDHLAHSFVEHGWSTKKLIRAIVLSRVYQLSATASPAAQEIDPDNVLLWRMNPRRLDAESLRDALLAISGQLNSTPPVGSIVGRVGEGPVARPRLGGDAIASAINDPRNTHRSVYLPIVRDNLPESLSLFDAADPSLITVDRPTTTVPSQGLYLLNNAFVLRAADATAERLLKAGATTPERVQAAYLLFYGRPPSDREVATAGKFLDAFRAQLARDRVSATRQERESWSAFCHALFASAEFQYRK